VCLKRLAWDGVLLALSFRASAQSVTEGDTIKLAGVTYVTGTVDRELLARNEYLAIESRIFMAQLMVGLRRHGLPPAPAPERKRRTTWATFVRTHVALLAGWTDFFTAEVLTLRGLVTCYVLFLIHLESRRVDVAGITVHPSEACTCSLR
jgi:hypothetical protein